MITLEYVFRIEAGMGVYCGLRLVSDGDAESCPQSGVIDCFLLNTGNKRSEDMVTFSSKLCSDGRESFKEVFYLVCHQTVIIPRLSKLINMLEMLLMNLTPQVLHKTPRPSRSSRSRPDNLAGWPQ